MNKFSKALVGTVAAGAMAVSATPAMASTKSGGIDAGTVIAGALVIGGIAAVAAAASKKNNNGYDYGRDYRFGSRYAQGSQQIAVDQCVRAAEGQARHFANGRADVNRITSVSSKRDGYDVKGRIVVDTRNWRGRGYETGSFTCKVRYGRISDLKFSGIRNLR